jgi:hypothetical protein
MRKNPSGMRFCGAGSGKLWYPAKAASVSTGKYSLSARPTALAAWRARSHATRVSGFTRWATSINSERSYWCAGSIGTRSIGRSAFEYPLRSGARHGAVGPGATWVRSRSGRSPPL